MGNNSSFETVKISLDKELSGFDDNVELGAGNWLSFGYIPSNVTVYFALDNNSNSKIKALQGLQIQAKHDKVYLWSVGTNATEQMEIMHWWSDNTKLIMPPSSDFESLNSYGSLALLQMQSVANNAVLSSTALSQFDKIINPYNNPVLKSYNFLATTTDTTVLNTTLTCDKITIKSSAIRLYSTGTPLDNTRAIIYINGAIVSSVGGYADGTGRQWDNNDLVELEAVNGKSLTIRWISSHTNTYLGVTLQEYTLK